MSRPKVKIASQQERVPEGMAGLAKGLAIVEAFTEKRSRLTVADAARASRTSRASARRCLLTLAELGYLEYDGKFFRPQPRLLRLGSAYTETRSLPQIAQPILTAARDELEESISFAVLAEFDVLFIARAEAERSVLSGVSVGARVAAYCTATGRVLLGQIPEEELRNYLGGTELVSRTPKTITSRKDILDAILVAKRRGFAVSDEELELGLRSVALPVVNSKRDIVGAISASAGSARVSAGTMAREFVPILQRYAERLGRAL